MYVRLPAGRRLITRVRWLLILFLCLIAAHRSSAQQPRRPAAQTPRPTSRPATPTPRPETQWKVRCHWNGVYSSGAVYKERASGTEVSFLKKAPLNGVFVNQCNIRIREEFQESSGQLRAILEEAKWNASHQDLHWIDKYGTRTNAGNGGSGSGEYMLSSETSTPLAKIQYTSRQGEPDQVSLDIQLELESDDTFPRHQLSLDRGDTPFSTVVKAGDIHKKQPDVIVPIFSGEFKPDGTVIRWTDNKDFDGTSGWERYWVLRQSTRPVLLQLSPCPKDWIPALGGKRSESVIPFNVRVVDPPGASARWRYRLEKVSQLPGICNNANMPAWKNAEWQGTIGNYLNDLLFDFRRYAWREPRYVAPENPWQVLELREPAASDTIEVTCLDYGASGRLVAEGEIGGLWHKAVVKETEEKFARIPFAKKDVDDDRIANAATPTKTSGAPYPVARQAEDLDARPVGFASCKGDGLSVFEEYRGFMLRDLAGLHPDSHHSRLDPQKKDLFLILDRKGQPLAQHLQAFETASELSVCRIGDDPLRTYVNSGQDPDRRTVNFNRQPGTGRPQHALYLTVDNSLPSGINGRASNFGPPVNVTSIGVSLRSCASNERMLPNFTRRVVIHELAHGIGVLHHGQTNRGDAAANTPELRLPVAVGNKTYTMVAVQGGQNSGDDKCAMKYVLWNFYLRNAPRSVPTTYSRARERAGLLFCKSAVGSGINKIGTPDWHCGNATLGNCVGQFRISDACARPATGAVSGSSESTARGWTDGEDEAETSATGSRERAEVLLSISSAQATPATMLPGTPMILYVQVQGLGYGRSPTALKKLDGPQSFQLLGLDAAGKWEVLNCTVTAGRATRSSPENPYEPHDAQTFDLTSRTVYMLPLVIETSAPQSLGRVFLSAAGRTERVISESLRFSATDPQSLPPSEREPLEIASLHARAEVHLHKQQTRLAEELCRQALARDTNRRPTFILLAQILEAQDQLREAYEQYQRALVAPPEFEIIEEPPYDVLFAMRRIEERLGMEPQPLLFDPVTSTPVDQSPLTSVTLAAVVAGTTFGPPFNTAAEKLSLGWQCDASASDPLGIRWIAQDTGGVVPTDRVIGSAKSQPGQREGVFTLSRPAAGFPPGMYRVEIWHAGKTVYTDSFEVIAGANHLPVSALPGSSGP
ncbi:MAG: hypothetical protein ACR2IE_02755 [Candidatus Sumerlaeaceae bacterium]